MEIILKQTGGFIPMKKIARAEVTWSQEEFETLITTIAIKHPSNPRLRDAFSFSLTVDNQEFPIDIGKIPPHHQPFFDKLQSKMKIIPEGGELK